MSVSVSDRDVIFKHPDWKAMREEGLQFADMHFHTDCSDSYTSVDQVLKLTEKRGTGVAITDHNLVKNASKLFRDNKGRFIIPGMEISTLDGPHILVYFYNADEMEEYWSKCIKPYMCRSPWLSIGKDTEWILDSLEDVNCIISAAHPLGYFMFTKGVQKAINKNYLTADTAKRLDAYEVICSGMFRKENIGAKEAADIHGIGYTGGTDGHLSFELGNVVTVSEEQDLDGFLDSIRKKRTAVVGREKDPFSKVLMGGASMSRFITYLPSSVVRQYQVNLGKDSARHRNKLK